MWKKTKIQIKKKPKNQKSALITTLLLGIMAITVFVKIAEKKIFGEQYVKYKEGEYMTQLKVWPTHTQVLINPNSEYLDQGVRKTKGKTEYLVGTITRYYEGYGAEEGQPIRPDTEDHIYWVNWGKSYSDCYRPRDLILYDSTNSSFLHLLQHDL